MHMDARNSEVLRLHILRGSFLGAGGGGGGCPMDASVWSRLPDDMLWRVLGFLPAAKLFQLHSVSRGWGWVLTSRRFRDTIGAAAVAAEDPERQWRRRGGVVACVSAGNAVNYAVTRVVDVDLTSFVPSWFWNRHRDRCTYAAPATASFSVVAVGNGLVCICNHLQCRCPVVTGGGGIRYCVLNPLTRTCVVLPPAPFLPPPVWLMRPLGCLLPSEGAAAAPALTVCKWDGEECMLAATCDLQQAAAADDGGGPRGITLRKSVVAPPACLGRCPPAVAQCGGEFFFYHAGRVHVLAAPPTGTAPTSKEEAPGTKRPRLDEAGGAADADAAATFDGPSVASLGLNAAAIGYQDDSVFLVAHRGAIFLVAQLLRRPVVAGGGGAYGGYYTVDPQLTAGVWRLDRRRRAWEPVSRLDAPQARRLVEGARVPLTSASVVVRGASEVKNLLSCEFCLLDLFNAYGIRELGSSAGFVLGFNHDAGEWEVVRADDSPAHVLHLRPDLFLS